jgi:hydrogenase expression/formation protein HypC
MCLAIPALVVELLPEGQAVVELGGIRKEISIALVADVRVGDYVVVHVGHAIGTIEPQEAERTLAMFAEMKEAHMPSDAFATPRGGLASFEAARQEAA